MSTTNPPRAVACIRFVRLLPPSKAYVVPENHVVIEWLAGYLCPACGMAGHWRSGIEFEHEMRCFHGCDPAPVWEPGLAYLKLVSHEPNVPDQATARK